MNFCINCKHCEFNTQNPNYSMCKRPIEPILSPVTGDRINAQTRNMPCQTERDYCSHSFMCGPEGKFFEPKTPTEKPPIEHIQCQRCGASTPLILAQKSPDIWLNHTSHFCHKCPGYKTPGICRIIKFIEEQ